MEHNIKEKEALESSAHTKFTAVDEEPSGSSETYIPYGCPTPYSSKQVSSYNESGLHSSDNGSDVEGNHENINTYVEGKSENSGNNLLKKHRFRYFSKPSNKNYQKLTTQSSSAVADSTDIELVALQQSSSSSSSIQANFNTAAVPYEEEQPPINTLDDAQESSNPTPQPFFSIRQLYLLPKLWARWRRLPTSHEQQEEEETDNTCNNTQPTVQETTQTCLHSESLAETPTTPSSFIHVIPIGRRTIHTEAQNEPLQSVTESSNEETLGLRVQSLFTTAHQNLNERFQPIQTRLLEFRDTMMQRFEHITSFTRDENEPLDSPSDDPTHQQLIFFGGILIAPYFFAIGAFLLLLTPRSHKRTRAWGIMNLIACMFLSLCTLLSNTVDQRPLLSESTRTFRSSEHKYNHSIDPFISNSLLSGLLWVKTGVTWTRAANANWPSSDNDWRFVVKSPHDSQNFQLKQKVISKNDNSTQPYLFVIRKPSSTRNSLDLPVLQFRALGTVLLIVNGLEWSTTSTNKVLNKNFETDTSSSPNYLIGEKHIVFNNRKRFYTNRSTVPYDYCGVGLKCKSTLYDNEDQWVLQACNTDREKSKTVVQRLGFYLNDKTSESSDFIEFSWLCEFAVFFSNETESIYLESIQLRELP